VTVTFVGVSAVDATVTFVVSALALALPALLALLFPLEQAANAPMISAPATLGLERMNRMVICRLLRSKQ
jgi:hypothetical protein